jgi:hypothetical protein
VEEVASHYDCEAVYYEYTFPASFSNPEPLTSDISDAINEGYVFEDSVYYDGYIYFWLIYPGYGDDSAYRFAVGGIPYSPFFRSLIKCSEGE